MSDTISATPADHPGSVQAKPTRDQSEPPAPRPSGLKEADFVQSLARGLTVIRSFDAERPRQTLSDVARTTGLTRATARRLLLTLTDLGYMSRSGQEFFLAPGVLELGYSYLSAMGTQATAVPHLETLSELTNESASMSVLDGVDIVYVARVATKRIYSLALSVGSRLPAFATSMGRVLLSEMPDPELDAILTASDLTARTARTLTDPDEIRGELARTRSQGWSLVDEELELGLRSVAAPIRDASGKIIAAINVSTPAARVSLEALHETMLPQLLSTAEDITRAMRNR